MFDTKIVKISHNELDVPEIRNQSVLRLSVRTAQIGFHFNHKHNLKIHRMYYLRTYKLNRGVFSELRLLASTRSPPAPGRESLMKSFSRLSGRSYKSSM